MSSLLKLFQPTKSGLGIWLPLYLFFVGTAVALFRNNAVFTAGALAVSLAAVGFSYGLIFNQSREIRITWILAAGLLLGYAGGTLNTSTQLLSKGMAVADYVGRSQNDLSIALSVVFWVAALLFFLGAVAEPPIKIDGARVESRGLRLVLFGLILLAAGFYTGAMGYMGVASTPDHHVSPLGELGGLFGTVLPALTIFIMRANPSLRERLLTYLLLALEFVALVPQGRRVTLYAIVVSAVAFNLRGFKWRIALWKKALVAILVLGGVYVTNVVFYSMRYMKDKAGKTEVSLAEISQGAIQFILNGRDAQFDEGLAENVQDRTLILLYFSDLLVASRHYTPLHGADALYCVKIAIPSVIYPDKFPVLLMEETLANPNFGMPEEDDANSILTTGVSDFGIVGAFVYPVVLAFSISGFIRLLTSKMPALVKIVVLFIVWFNVFQAETSGVIYMSMCRDLILLSAILTILSKLGGIQNSSPGKDKSLVTVPLVTTPQVPATATMRVYRMNSIRANPNRS